MCDSSSFICLPQNLVFHRKEKHIKVRYHFLRDHVEKGDIVMKYIDVEKLVPCFASLRGGGGVLVFAIPVAWFEGELVFGLVYTLFCILFLFCCISFILT
jgi:hypothetical protein